MKAVFLGEPGSPLKRSPQSRSKSESKGGKLSMSVKWPLAEVAAADKQHQTIPSAVS